MNNHATPTPALIIPVICDRCRAEGNAGNDPFAGVADILNFEPVPRRAHADGWTPEYQRAFIAALAITGSSRRAGRAIGKHAFGAEQLRTARGGRSFAAAWDAALEIYRDREMARLRDNLAGLAQAEEQRAEAQPFGPGGGDDDDEEDGAGRREYLEARERIRQRLLNARRLFLAGIKGDPAKRAAWETLVGPVDWEKAGRLEPQADEDELVPAMSGPDMLICAETGLLPELTGGPSVAQRLLDALEEMKAELGAEGLAALAGKEG